MPSLAAVAKVLGWVAATQIGGCGFWIGFGTRLRGGMSKYLPWWPGNLSFMKSAQIASSDSCQMSRDSSWLTPNASIW